MSLLEFGALIHYRKLLGVEASEFIVWGLGVQGFTVLFWKDNQNRDPIGCDVYRLSAPSFSNF